MGTGPVIEAVNGLTRNVVKYRASNLGYTNNKEVKKPNNNKRE